MKKLILITTIIIIVSNIVQAQDADPSKLEGYYYATGKLIDFKLSVNTKGEGTLEGVAKRTWQVLQSDPVQVKRIGSQLIIISSSGDSMVFHQYKDWAMFESAGGTVFIKQHEDKAIAEAKIKESQAIWLRFNP